MMTQKEMMSFFFKANKWKLNRCLAPGMNCEGKAIRAHSIQNSRVFDLLCRKDHVVVPSKKIDKEKKPVIFFNEIGRNNASTFTGLRSNHDTQLFRVIDTVPFDPYNQEHLFLIAYRAVIRELYAVMDGAIKIQSTYNRRVNAGWDSGDVPSAAGMLSVEHMMKAYLTYLYKEHFDRMQSHSRFNEISHSIIRLVHERATVAVGSLYSVDEVLLADDVLRIVLNVIPISHEETFVVFSYLTVHANEAQEHLSRVLSANGHYQKYEVSKLILNNCENFVLSPFYYDTWSQQKVDAVTGYFIQTLFKSDTTVDNEHLYLF